MIEKNWNAHIAVCWLKTKIYIIVIILRSWAFGRFTGMIFFPMSSRASKWASDWARQSVNKRSSWYSKRRKKRWIHGDQKIWWRRRRSRICQWWQEKMMVEIEWIRRIDHWVICFTRAHRRTVSRNTMKSTRRVLGHSLVRSLTPLTHWLAPHCSPCPRALIHTFTRSRAHGKDVCLWIECVDFMQFQPTAPCSFVCLLALELMIKRFLSMKGGSSISYTVFSRLRPPPPNKRPPIFWAAGMIKLEFSGVWIGLRITVISCCIIF